MKEVEILKESEGFKQNEEESLKSHSLKTSTKAPQSRLESEASCVSSSKCKTHKSSNLLAKKANKKSRKPVVGVGTSNQSDKDSDRGPYLLKQARDLTSSGSTPRKALDLALQGASCSKKSSNGKPNLYIVMCTRYSNNIL
ncbi:hypothetical protein L1987_41367 [Smallanthus sonchifolius]|uniref:Uncharacterized protein n=1 Tax=Smallanthus sonchifolius TaxID=185202 RepID=A0ACB9GU99_9ASTR|nr:hypothetical protein L1987_41367 [Smallanthus sonchifolius]